MWYVVHRVSHVRNEYLTNTENRHCCSSPSQTINPFCLPPLPVSKVILSPAKCFALFSFDFRPTRNRRQDSEPKGRPQGTWGTPAGRTHAGICQVTFRWTCPLILNVQGERTKSLSGKRIFIFSRETGGERFRNSFALSCTTLLGEVPGHALASR